MISNDITKIYVKWPRVIGNESWMKTRMVFFDFFNTKKCSKIPKVLPGNPDGTSSNMISPGIFAGALTIYAGPCPRGPHSGDGVIGMWRLGNGLKMIFYSYISWWQLKMWRSSNSNSTTFELRTFSADSKCVEIFDLITVEFELHVCAIGTFTNYNRNKDCLHYDWNDKLIKYKL